MQGRRVHNAFRLVRRFGRRMVEEAFATGKKREGTDRILIDYIKAAVQDLDLVADASLNFLSAGKDTLAQALTWTFYLLMHHPEVVKSIRDELQLLHNKSGMLELDYSTLQPLSMPYVHATLNEALRLFPPIPFEIKQCMHSVTLPDDTFLPQGSIVIWSPWAMGRSRAIWGEDADGFKPERWLERKDSGLHLKTKSAAEYPVFNGGQRLCLGKRMAEMEGAYVIASLVWSFDFEDASQDRQRVSRNSLTLPMDGGLPCRVRLRA